MRILIMNNVASMQAITADALNKIKGVSCQCVVYGDQSKYISQFPSTVTLKVVTIKQNFLLYLYYKWITLITILKMIRQADIIHYVWAPMLPFSIDLFLVKLFKKKCFVEFVGSDIRKPSTLFELNKFYKQVFNHGYEYVAMESKNESEHMQKIFADINAFPTVCPEISIFLNKKLFPQHYTYMQRINLVDFLPHYPSVANKKPIIIHSPSAKIAKGTNIILPIIEDLKKDYDFEFVLLHDLPRAKVLEIMMTADIFLDQIILGSYGLATCEAMAYGKPVLCYLMPAVFEAGLDPECPIVNSNPENLRQQLIDLLDHPEKRNQIGKLSRKYVEKYHDADKIAKELITLYSSALTNPS